jgi:predicted CopG family antitoxin
MYSFISIGFDSTLRPSEVTIKTIPISEEVYELLERLRLPGERYDDTILRLAGIKSRGKDFDKAFKEALDEVVKDDAELLEKLAQ